MPFDARHMQSAHGRCDSFFVEQGDDFWYEQKNHEREQARLGARERQRTLAGRLSKITSEEYQQDVLSQMELMEARTLADVNSIDVQSEIQWYMRPYLIDFLVEAHSAFSLLPDTLYLTINLLDRYCSRRIVYKRHYQLVGCAALLVAAKYGDRKERVPQIKELKAMCCSLYEEDMFTQMEWHLLQTLDWQIGHPTVDSFLQIAMADGGHDREIEHLSWYILELALSHKDFVSVLPSVLARSTLYLARVILSRTSRLSPWAGICDSSVVARLYAQLSQPSSVVAKKYSAYQLSSVAFTVQSFVERQAQLELERQRQLAPQTPPVELSSWACKAGTEVSYGPQTPQKRAFAPAVNNGLYTPPITPENDNGQVQYTVHVATLPPLPPATPTPFSDNQQHPLRHDQTTYELPQAHPTYWAS